MLRCVRGCSCAARIRQHARDHVSCANFANTETVECGDAVELLNGCPSFLACHARVVEGLRQTQREGSTGSVSLNRAAQMISLCILLPHLLQHLDKLQSGRRSLLRLARHLFLGKRQRLPARRMPLQDEPLASPEPDSPQGSKKQNQLAKRLDYHVSFTMLHARQPCPSSTCHLTY